MTERLIYFMQNANGEGPIKIGCTADLDARLRQLSCDYRTKLTVLTSAPGDYLLERNLHLKFAAMRAEAPINESCRASPIAGSQEWFEATPSLLAYVERVKATGGIELTTSEQREKIFAERYLAGETLEQIATDFNITRERVRQVLRATGVESLGLRDEHKRSASPPTADELLALSLYQSDVRPREIVKRTGVSNLRINQLLHRFGIPAKSVSQWLTRDDDVEITEAVCRLYREGKSTSEIVEAVPQIKFQPTVYRYLRKGGIEPSRRSRTGVENAAQVAAKYRDGASISQLATEHNVSATAIKTALRKSGVHRSQADNEQRRIAAVIEANRRRWQQAA